MSQGKYARVEWTPHDVQTLAPKWTIEECEAWLQQNARFLQEELVVRGWECLEAMLPVETKGLELTMADLEIGDFVLAEPRDADHAFVGSVVGFRADDGRGFSTPNPDTTLVSVRDLEDNVWDCHIHEILEKCDNENEDND